MSTSTSVVSLGADLVVFLAAATLLVVLILHPGLLGVSPLGRTVLAGAATLLATVALLHGADLAPALRQDWLDRLRVASVVMLAAACLTRGARRPRLALLGSLALLAVAELAFRGEDDPAGQHLLRLLGGCGIGLALWLAARRSLATRIAAAAGVLLVTVVLLLSGVLSAVMTERVSGEGLRSAADRAEIEAGLIAEKATDAARQASLIGKILRASTGERLDEETIRRSLEEELKSEDQQVDFLAFLDPARTPVAATQVRTGPGLLVGLPQTRTVQEALARKTSAGGVEAMGKALVALGAAWVVSDPPEGQKIEGAVVAGFFLDHSYLGGRIRHEGRTASRGEPAARLHLSLVTEIRVLATTFSPRDGPAGPAELLQGGAGAALVRDVFRSGGARPRQGRFAGEEVFVAAAPVPLDADGGPAIAMAVTVDGSVVEEARAALFRTLFLVALGAAALALVLAAATGSRLGAPLRELATVAEQISGGDLSVRSGLRTPDEIGVLGSAFDEMVGSIEGMASDLRGAAARMEAVLNSMTDGLVATDHAGLVAMMNPAAEAMLGVQAAHEVGQSVAAVIRGRDRSGASLADRFAPRDLDAWSATGFVEHGDGLLPVAFSGAPIRSEPGEVLGAVYVLRDMRRELEVERAKTEFLSNVSHELRTPLTPIKGYAEMLRRDQQSPEARRLPPEKIGAFLEGILESSERLERTVDILVNFAAMEAGRLVLGTEPVDVGALVHDVCERWRPRSDRHRIEEIVIEAPRVVGDHRLLERSIDELMDNAVKYSPEGGTVTVRAQLIGTVDERAVEISVADEGIGFAPADLESVFADFSQLDGSATRPYGGLGLGLAFVQRVVAAHDGTIVATSEPRRGSLFAIRLPVKAMATGEP